MAGEAFLGVYRGRRVLVTGHTGFKGGWLALWLTALGAEVLGYALEPPTDPNFFEAVGLGKRVAHVHGDIRDGEALRQAFTSFCPEMAFHLAAQPLVLRSYEEPVLTFSTNVMGTVNLLEAFRSSPSCRVLVNVTSDKCYRNPGRPRVCREGDPLGGDDPYSASKGCAELVTAAYRKSFFTGDGDKALASVRAGNVIGGGDWGRDRLVPDLIRSLSGGRPVTLRNPRAVRPWQFMLEPLSGYLWLGALMWWKPRRYGGAWNFGPAADRTISVVELAGKVVEAWGCGELEVVSDRPAAPEAFYLALSSTRANRLLGWHPVYSLEQALQATVRWYRSFYQGIGPQRLQNLSLAQISEYCSAARAGGLCWSGAAAGSAYPGPQPVFC